MNKFKQTKKIAIQDSDSHSDSSAPKPTVQKSKKQALKEKKEFKKLQSKEENTEKQLASSVIKKVKIVQQKNPISIQSSLEKTKKKKKIHRKESNEKINQSNLENNINNTNKLISPIVGETQQKISLTKAKKNKLKKPKLEMIAQEQQNKSQQKNQIVNNQPKQGNNGQFQACVMQISYEATQEDIKTHFQKCGKILNIKMIRKDDGRFKGLAFIKFGKKEQFDKAIQLNGSQINGRQIKVALAIKRQNKGPVQDAPILNIKSPKIDKKKNQQKNVSTINKMQEKIVDAEQKKINKGKSQQKNTSKEKKQEKSENKNFGEDKPVVIDNPTIFIGNLAFNSTVDSMKNLFKKCGNVKEVRIAQDRKTGKKKGFGYVEFSSVEEANKAYKMFNGKQLDGRVIRIDSATVREKRQKKQEVSVEKEKTSQFSGKRPSNSRGNNTSIYSHVQLSEDDKNAKAGRIGQFQGKKVKLQ